MLTPVESINGIFVKRDDLFSVANVCGGKARTCWHLAQKAKGLITAGSRHSPQVAIVASIAVEKGIPCHVHVPQGVNTPMLEFAIRKHARVIRHKPGYNGVIISRARQDAEETGFVNIPFGMECAEAVNQTLVQTNNIPKEAQRIVIPVGSGMSLAGILTGCVANGIRIPVLGVRVGADPSKRLDKYAPLFWRSMVTLITSRYKYDEYCYDKIENIELDEVYEAKCVEYLEPGDLFWIIGKRPRSLE